MIALSERQQAGRAMNALREYFVRKLVVPKIFFNTAWNGERLDLLAIDRTGVGDVHALRFVHHQRVSGESTYTENVFTTLAAAEEIEKHLSLAAKEELHSLAAQYRYVAVVDSTGGTLFLQPSDPFKKLTFSEDGIGRVGMLYIDVASDDVVVKEIIKPERFRSTPSILDLTDKYVATHTADAEYRDPVEYQIEA